jgi:hypothetical protein
MRHRKHNKEDHGLKRVDKRRHSYFKAMSGSALAARMAGGSTAASATSRTLSMGAVRLQKSVGLTANNVESRSRPAISSHARLDDCSGIIKGRGGSGFAGRQKRALVAVGSIGEEKADSRRTNARKQQACEFSGSYRSRVKRQSRRRTLIAAKSYHSRGRRMLRLFAR